MKKILFVTLLTLSAQICADNNICDKLAGNPFDNTLKTSGVEFTNINPKKAIKACKLKYLKDLNNIRVIYQLGRSYQAGKNYQLALKYYTLSCNKKYGLACNALGIANYLGEWIDESNTNAMYYYKKACKYSSPQGCHNVAGLYHYGKGVDINLKTAKKYYLNACKLGYKESCKYFNSL